MLSLGSVRYLPIMIRLPRPSVRLTRRAAFRGVAGVVLAGAASHFPAHSAGAATITGYREQGGDTVTAIARSLGVTVADLAHTNQLADPSFTHPSETSSAATSAAPVGRLAGVVAIAQKYLGAPYAWGGTSPGGFDCSGFVWFVYHQAGIPLPRDLWGQLQAGPRVSRLSLEPGDLVFFANTYQSGLSHVGIYLGAEHFIHAEDYGTGVVISSLANSYWGGSYFAASRPG